MPIWEKFARKSCASKVQGATQGEPHPSLPWPVVSGREQLIRPLLAFWSFAGFVHTVTRGIYAHPALWDESVPSNRAGSSLAESFGTLSTTHTHKNRHTWLFAYFQQTDDSIFGKVLWKVLSGTMIRFGQHNVHMTKHDKTWPCHLNPMSKVWSRYSCVVLEGIRFEFARTVIVILFVFA